ncbi:hypothetical protein MX081_07875 [Streptococcus uberis]|nr:hypothetical protein [Streptococcus uberis]
MGNLSEKPFTLHGQKLVNEIDKVLDLVPEQANMILCNQYITKTPLRKSRKQFCHDQNISIEQYIELRESALTLREFEKHYLNGTLLEQRPNTIIL